MKPDIIRRQVLHAQAVASGLHDTALLCTPDQAALSARLMGGAREIDVLVALVEALERIAKLNHDTIVEIGNDRADRVQTLCTGEGPDHQRGEDHRRSDDAGAGLESVRRADLSASHLQGDPQ